MNRTIKDVCGLGRVAGPWALALAAALTVGLVADAGSAPTSVRATRVSQDGPDFVLNAGRVVTTWDGEVSVSGTHVLRRRASETGAGAAVHEYTVQHGQRDPVVLSGAPTAGRQPIKQSGVYSLVGGTIYEPTRNNGMRQVFSTGTKNTDLFGQDLIWSSGGKVMRRSLVERRDSVVTETYTMVRRGAAGPVATWGQRWAYLDQQGVIHVRGGLRFNRLVQAGPWASDLRLNYGTLSWTARNGSIHMINLADSRSRPFRFAKGGSYSIDAEKIADVGPKGKIRVRDLPFDVGNQPPTVIWEQIAPTATVGGNWRPQFEISKPVTSVEMSVQNRGSRVTRVLRSSGRLGTVRGLNWDGKGPGRAFGLGCSWLVLRIKSPGEPVVTIRRDKGIWVVEPEDPQHGECARSRGLL